MLITFKASNFLSFNEEINFSMRAGTARDLKEHVIKGENRNDVDILKSAIVYGANASGKSNLIKAVEFAKNLIVKGLNDISTENKHFRLDKSNIEKPTQFEFEFKHKGNMYAYGIVLSLKEQKIKEEWLFKLLKTTDKPIFERKVLSNGKSDIEINLNFDKEAEIRFDVYKKDIKDTQLFLTEINDKNIDEVRNIESFKDVFDWFKNELVIIYPTTKFVGLDFIGNDEEMQTAFCEFLNLFNTGIAKIQSIEDDFESKIPEKIREKIFKDLHQQGQKAAIVGIGENTFSFIKNENGEIKLLKLQTQHTIKNSKEFANFEIKEESDGTQRIMDLIPILVGLSKTQKTYFIDEIDRSLHPELTKKILETFFTNTKNSDSQLIVTTHESSLLDLSFLRRDEIWFVEKDKEGASTIYSLEQFKPRHDKEIRKSYLQGRFGAIPFITNVENLHWLKSSETL